MYLCIWPSFTLLSLFYEAIIKNIFLWQTHMHFKVSRTFNVCSRFYVLGMLINFLLPTKYVLYLHFLITPIMHNVFDNIWNVFSLIDTGRVNTVVGRLQCLYIFILLFKSKLFFASQIYSFKNKSGKHP